MNVLLRAALLATIGVSAVIAGAIHLSGSPVQAALGGPVIIGGDDLTDHGCNDGEFNLEGWLYIQRALENINPNVTRSNDGTIAALGSEDVAGEIICDDAGSGIYHAAAALGITVVYYNGDGSLGEFFADLASGAAQPAIIWIAGTGASNDIEDNEAPVLTANAQAISDFVSEGGGLFSHGSEYGWLFALLPDALATGEGSEDDLYFTPEGLDALPALTEGDINAGPWHNHFEGDFGGLEVLVRSNSVDDALGDDAAVILGGAEVTFEENPTEVPNATSTPCIPPLVTYRCDGSSGGGGGGGSNPTSTPAASQPTAVSTVAAATVVPAQPTRPTGVVVSAPDTGAGPGDGGSGSMLALLVMAAGGVAVAGAGVLTLQAKRARR